MVGFRWTGRREQAAFLVAEDRLTNEEIAAQVGVTRQAVDKWKANPEFKARVAEHVDQLRNAILEVGIQDRSCRVAALEDRWRRLKEVIESRAREMSHIPGGSSGILVAQPKLLRMYESAGDDEFGDALKPLRQVVVMQQYVVDTGLLRELRQHERQAAEELGEWREKPEEGEKLVRVYVGVETERV